MSELRAPDPTLTALAASGEPYTWQVVVNEESGVPFAHRVEAMSGPMCERPISRCALTPTEFARWFAVPCRMCFPDAPPPGMDGRHGGSGAWFEVDGLAWQVPS